MSLVTRHFKALLLLLVPILFVSSSASSPTHGNQSLSFEENECNVYIPSIYVWNWQPAAVTVAEDGASATPTVPTNPDGTQTAIITVTTSARMHDGTWEALTSLSTLAFPTGRYDMPASYEWCSSSACSSNSTTTVMMPTSVFYPAASFAYDTVQTATGKGLHWSLHPTYVVAGPLEVSWFRSVYSDQAPLQECKPTSTMGTNGRPPIALQPYGMIGPTVSTAEAVSTTAQPIPAHTLGRIHGLATQLTESSAATQANDEGDRERQSEHIETANPSEQTTRPVQHQSYAAHSTRHPPSVTSTSKLEETVRVSRYRTDPASSSKIATSETTATRHDKQEPAGTYTIHSGKTTPPGGSAVSVPIATIPVVMSGTTVLNSQISPISNSPSHAVQVFGNVTLSMTDGNVVFHGQTLVISSTLTIGTGSAITRLALGTDSAGDTVFLGESTISANRSTVARVQPTIQSSLPRLTYATQAPSSSVASSPGLVSASSAESSLRPTRWSIFGALILAMFNSKYGYGTPFR
ncbi:uncharacterized protein LTR77_008925 [Saxophila tyrrhenica]|uniref:Uncharacterized protein n=1 Tax=Saxophila tyrrhenica TaxID=1690608 RepID=A0AAV9P2F7_9PEZI|nr:hypothetical protein LTR77_008925 [Saxophila tyrrhenica]